MGWWGYRSYENDNVGDLMSEVMRHGIDAAIDESDEDHLGVIVQFIEIGAFPDGKNVTRAYETALRLFEDEDHLSEFKSPVKRREALHDEVSLLHSVLRR